MRVEWRALTGWSDGELQAFLGRAERLPVNFTVAEAEMVPASGWNLVRSRAVIAREAPGLPHTDGAFARATWAVSSFAFSDPRIVRAHLDPDARLRGRTMLLELRPTALRFLCPVRVGEVRQEADADTTCFAFCIDTLAGHVERGREWFLVHKDHATGEVSFQVRAAWRAGDFPNAWTRLGFALLARRYQRAWHHLAHVRLRELVRRTSLLPARRGPLLHTGPAIHTLPVQFFAQPALGRWRAAVQSEVEDLPDHGLLLAGALGAVAGLRTTVAPLVLSQRLACLEEPPTEGAATLLCSPRTVGILGVLALGELVADKVPGMPDRIGVPGLLGRALSGALVGAAVASRRSGRAWRYGAIGAGAAVVAAFLGWSIRRAATRRAGVPDVVAGLVEDTIALGAGAAIGAALE